MYSAFCCPAYRELVREQHFRFVVAPCLIFLLTFIFIYLPDLWISPVAKLLILGSIFFIVNSYHFAVQHYGVLSIYRIRAGQSTTEKFKAYEKNVCLIVGGLLVAVGQICHGAEVVDESLFYQLFSRERVHAVLGIMQVLAPMLILALVVPLLRAELRHERSSTPKIVYLVGLAIQGIAAFFLDPLPFLILWAVQHWLVSVALAAHMAENDRSEVDPGTLPRWYRFWRPVSRKFLFTVAALVLLSLLLTPLLRVPINLLRGSEVPQLSAWLIPYLQYEKVILFLIALNFASVYVHFVYDRAIFRFSNPSVRKVSVPLLFRRSP